MRAVHITSVRSWLRVSQDNHNYVAENLRESCPHCGEKVIFTLSNFLDDSSRKAISASSVCAGCNKQVSFWFIRERNARPGEAGQYPATIYMFPVGNVAYAAPKLNANVPEPLQRSFFSTVDSLNAKNYPATAVSARRTLEGIFKYLVPVEKRDAPLAKLIEEVVKTTDLSKPLTLLSHAVRQGGNLGAHFDEVNEPNADASYQMVKLVEYLISYLYILPNEIKMLEEQLAKPSA